MTPTTKPIVSAMVRPVRFIGYFQAPALRPANSQ